MFVNEMADYFHEKFKIWYKLKYKTFLRIPRYANVRLLLELRIIHNC